MALIVNIDSDYGKRIFEEAKCKIFTFGIEEEADFRAIDIVTKPDNVEFKLVSLFDQGEIKVNIPGKFSIYNALAAISACLLMKIPFTYIRKGLEKVSVPGRAEVIEINKDYTMMIDYAHSPDSLYNILSTIKEYAPGRLICLFGCGGDRDKTKRPIMGEIAGEIADFTIVTSDNPRTEEPIDIINDILVGIKKISNQYKVIVDRREAIKYTMLNAKEQDIIILVGKGHETYQIFKDKTIHFDEKEVVKEILLEINGK